MLSLDLARTRPILLGGRGGADVAAVAVVVVDVPRPQLDERPLLFFIMLPSRVIMVAVEGGADLAEPMLSTDLAKTRPPRPLPPLLLDPSLLLLITPVLGRAKTRPELRRADCTPPPPPPAAAAAASESLPPDTPMLPSEVMEAPAVPVGVERPPVPRRGTRPVFCGTGGARRAWTPDDMPMGVGPPPPPPAVVDPSTLGAALSKRVNISAALDLAQESPAAWAKMSVTVLLLWCEGW